MINKDINYRENGTVFNIQRFSVNDGPGIRTIVFLKGCPLSCIWCSNPESQNKHKQIMFNIKNCINCHKCESICKVGAINFDSIKRIDRDKCINCGDCVDECFSNALVISGKKMNVKEVIKELNKDSVQFRRSKGGITLSGGEPLMQPKFSLELLKACKSMGWHTTIETTAYASKDTINTVIPMIDLVLLDIKTVNLDKHKKFVGVDNTIILDNAKEISNLGVDIIVRIPVIPEFNGDIESIYNIVKFAKELKTLKEIHLLPYHKLGVNKYECIGEDYKMSNSLNTPSDELMIQFKEIVEREGIKCNIGAH